MASCNAGLNFSGMKNGNGGSRKNTLQSGSSDQICHGTTQGLGRTPSTGSHHGNWIVTNGGGDIGQYQLVELLLVNSGEEKVVLVVVGEKVAVPLPLFQ